jgi:hypothetical protein
VPPTRWLRFIDDCGRFLDSGGIARAAALILWVCRGLDRWPTPRAVAFSRGRNVGASGHLRPASGLNPSPLGQFASFVQFTKFGEVLVTLNLKFAA